jgi:hypothetical protein
MMCGFMGCGGENGRFGGGVAATWYIEVGWPPTHEDFKLHSQIRATEISFSATFGGPPAAALREDTPRISITCQVYRSPFYTDSPVAQLALQKSIRELYLFYVGFNNNIDNHDSFSPLRTVFTCPSLGSVWIHSILVKNCPSSS